MIKKDIFTIVFTLLFFDFLTAVINGLRFVWFYLNDRNRKKYTVLTADFTETQEGKRYRVSFKTRMDGQKIEGSFIQLFDDEEYKKIKSKESLEVHIWQKDSKWKACTTDFSKKSMARGLFFTGCCVAVGCILCFVLEAITH